MSAGAAVLLDLSLSLLRPPQGSSDVNGVLDLARGKMVDEDRGEHSECHPEECLQLQEMYWQELKETLSPACQSHPLRWKLVLYLISGNDIFQMLFFPPHHLCIFPLTVYHCMAVACRFSVFAKKYTFGVSWPVKHGN